MEQLPRHPEGGGESSAPGEDLARGEAQQIIEGGLEAAVGAGLPVEDWVARHIALQLKDEDGSGLDVFAQSGEVTVDLLAELRRAYIQHLQAPTLGRWLEALNAYAEHREDRSSVDGWVEQAIRRDQFHTAWWDRSRQRGNRHTEGRELDRAVRLAQDARQMVGDELAMRLLVRIAASPHSATARFAADRRVTDELSRELQERYLSGTEQERRWLNELGSWITASGQPSPVPWWRSPAAPVEHAAAEQTVPDEQAERRVARLADLEERLAPLPDLGDIPRPAWGHGFGNGWEWMEEGLPEGWYAEPIWGRNGWDLGAWPLIVVALFTDDERGRYAVATYTEGDIEIKRYKSRGALYVAVNKIAEFHWRLGQSRGPRDLPEGSGLLAHHTGPYPGWSEARRNEVEHHRDGQASSSPEDHR